MSHFQPTFRGETLEAVCLRAELASLTAEHAAETCPDAQKEILEMMNDVRSGLLHYVPAA